MARPDIQPGVEGGDGDGNTVPVTPATDVVRPATDVVRPGTGVVRPGTGVVRPGTGVVTPTESGGAKARAVVPDAPEKPLEPIHVVLPVIPVKEVKQGFLDRLVAGKPKKTEAEIAAEEAAKAAEEQRKIDEANRKAAEEAWRQAEEARRAEARDAAKAEAKAVEEARKAEVKALDDARKADAKAVEEARKADAKVAEEQRKIDEARRKAAEKARKAEAKAREKARDDEDDYDDDEDYEEPPSARMAPPRPAPTRPAPAPARPAPQRQTGPAPSRPQRAPERFAEPRRVPRPIRVVQAPARNPVVRWVALAVGAVLLGTGSALVSGAAAPPPQIQWVSGVDTGVAVPVLGGLDANAPRPSGDGLAAAIGPLLGDSAFGGRITASIVDVATGQSLYDVNGGAPVTPASTAKLLTAAAVLQTRGPNYQIATRAVAGSAPGEVVIIGGGDPTLGAGATTTYAGAARLDLLAEQVKKALGSTAPTRVIVDSSLYVGPSQNPGWYDDDMRAGFIAHATALMTDGARVDPSNVAQNASRHWEPDVAAGQIFAQHLGLPSEAASAGTAPPNARALGQVLSPPISRLVELMLAESDNVIAEGLARQVALAKNAPASFDGAAAATKTALGELGISSDGLGLADGSGLANANRVSAAQLTAVLAQAASPKNPKLRAIMTGLPVAGYSGTLAGRYLDPNSGGGGAGTVRAKTGTLSGVNSLAGIAVDRSGRLLAFSAVADATNNSGRALVALDRIAAAVAACGC